ncbi:hypothetical protein C6P45_001899 [Maudiozyma exigua]|uniref:C2H2-type domain-containing protein n=1 Tax=Maudiozyma exigua TaxID=34358 RepID=A0A9P6W0T1_MAUEX|nr:hypothetical protein C6P45_001899 [Kazachstania exigua]
MTPSPIDTRADLKKQSVHYLVNQSVPGGKSPEADKPKHNTPPKLVNILNTSGENFAPKKLTSKNLLFPSSEHLMAKPNSSIVLGKPSNERSYILSNSTLSNMEQPPAKLEHINSSTNLSESKNNKTLKSTSIVPFSGNETGKLRPLDIPVRRHTLDYRGSFEHTQNIGIQRRDINGDGSGLSSSLPPIGRSNSVLINHIRNDDGHFYPGRIQLPLTAPNAEGYYLKSVGHQPIHEVGYNSIASSRYNSVNTNTTDIDPSHRLTQHELQQQQQQQMMDAQQRYYEGPYRVNEVMAPGTAYPVSYSNNSYQRSGTNLYIPSSNNSSFRAPSNMSLSVPHLYPEPVTATGAVTPTLYDKFGRDISDDQNIRRTSYPQPLYQFSPPMANPQQLLPYATQDQHYHYQLATDHREDVPHYGKIPSHFHKKKINQCNICGKILTRPSSLHSHMFVHTGDRPYICKWPNCGKTFNVKSNMNRHYKLHLKRQVIDDKLGIKNNDNNKLINQTKTYILSQNDVRH